MKRRIFILATLAMASILTGDAKASPSGAVPRKLARAPGRTQAKASAGTRKGAASTTVEKTKKKPVQTASTPSGKQQAKRKLPGKSAPKNRLPPNHAALGAPKKSRALPHIAHVTLYKKPHLACCDEWAEHLRSEGFTVDIKLVDNPGGLSKKHGVPRQLLACHTARVNGYVIEGHVPANEIKRLVKARPVVVGLAVPGMPVGSPGLGGEPAQAYNVVMLRKDGQHLLYRHYPA